MINRYIEEDFNSFVEDLIRSGRLNEEEARIAQYMLDNGYIALSEPQKRVFDNAIRKNSVKECGMCAEDIPWNEMLNALDNGGLCSYCQHVKEKMDEE